MSRKSRKTAAKYSGLSRAGRRKQREKRSPETEAASTPEVQGVVESSVSPVGSRVLQPAAKAPTGQVLKPALKHSTGTYQSVRADLKRIGTLSAVIVLILIILSLVLD